jgi:TonB family protein
MQFNSECRDDRPDGGNVLVPVMFKTELGKASLPARGLLYSVLGHGFLAMALLYLPQSLWLRGEVRLVTAESMIHEHEVLLLPKLEPMGGGGPAAALSNGRDSAEEQDPASSYDSKAIQGVVYRGPQLLVSNPQQPDNFIQSIRQPDLADKTKLPAPLPLPPMVSIAPTKPVLAPQRAPDILEKPAQVAAVEPIKLPVEEPMIDVPKLPLPPAATVDAALHTVADLAIPASMPKLVHENQVAQKSDARNILVMDAISTADHKASVVPPGELHGTFTVSPVGATASSSAGGGVELVGAPGMANASGANSGPYAGSASKSSNKAGENKTDRLAGSGTGAGQRGTSGANGMGIASGPGMHGSGSGGGLGAGPGSSPFPSIMIQGGSRDRDGSIAQGQAIRTSKPQTAYGITIVANGSSGGGFKDFGVFRDEASYTVYLDMEDEGLYGSGWALQYALDSHRVEDLSHAAAHARGPLVPPYATSKLLPHFPPDAAKRVGGGAIVVFGVISQQGEFEDLRIMHSSDARLDQLLLASLRKWKFRPAEMDGAQVAVKVLLGVPVNSVLRQ